MLALLSIPYRLVIFSGSIVYKPLIGPDYLTGSFYTVTGLLGTGDGTPLTLAPDRRLIYYSELVFDLISAFV